MQFEDFDKKIKEAAEHHHPAYEEKAWKKMEKLLDKHMPVEKDDKRRFLFLLLLLVAGGAGIFLWISKSRESKLSLADKAATAIPLNKKEELKSAAAIPVPAEQKTGVADGNATKLSATKPEKTIVPAEASPSPETTTGTSPKTNSVATSLKIKNNSGATSKTNTGSAEKEPALAANNFGKTKRIVPIKSKEALVKNTQADQAGNTITATADAGTAPNADNTRTVEVNANEPDQKPVTDLSTNLSATAVDSTSKKAVDTAIAAQEKKKEEAVKKINPKSGKQKRNGFAFTFSAGPDLSAVAGGKIGKTRLSYGAGLSYTLNRFTVRSGFYFAKKVYAAGPDDYHPPKHYWTYYVDLTKVDADCRVYEIPVTVSYNFSTGKRHNLFAAAGLSSYLMKSETYDYAYKDRTTQMPDYKTWTLKNGSNHLFSIVNLSVGYERIINKTLSISAEPYFKIPTDGIGFGSVKLNSAGVLFTLNVKPFAAKK